MASKTKGIDIATGRFWDDTLMVVIGCTQFSPGCGLCWALAQLKGLCCKRGDDGKLIDNGRYPGIIGPDGQWTGKVICDPGAMDKALRRKKPTVYALSFWGDLFHEGVTDEFIFEVFVRTHQATQHQYLMLTKRVERLGLFCRENTPAMSHIWLGVTVCNQKEMDKAGPVLASLKVMGFQTWLSIEPMLEGIRLPLAWCEKCHQPIFEDGLCCPSCQEHVMGVKVDQVIVGGQTGSNKAASIHPDWVRAVRYDCVAAGVPFFFKNWGSNPHNDAFLETKGKINATMQGFNGGRILEGRTCDDLAWIQTSN